MRSQSYLAVVAVLVGSTPISLAADLAPAPPPPGPVAVVIPSWTGFYAGAHIGGAWTDWRTRTDFLAVSPQTGASVTGSFPGPNGSPTSFIGGGHVGYNWQSGRFLFGAEADISGLGGTRAQAFNISAAALVAAGLGAITDPVDGFESLWRREVEWLATVRGRLGFFITPSALLYVTGGFAVGGVERAVSFTGLVDQGTPQLVQILAKDRTVKTGFVVGGGGETAITEHLRLRLEYLYADLGTDTYGLGTYLQTACCIQTVSAREKVVVHTARVGLSYRFWPQ